MRNNAGNGKKRPTQDKQGQRPPSISQACKIITFFCNVRARGVALVTAEPGGNTKVRTCAPSDSNQLG